MIAFYSKMTRCVDERTAVYAVFLGFSKTIFHGIQDGTSSSEWMHD